jgi:hypothetical protein
LRSWASDLADLGVYRKKADPAKFHNHHQQSFVYYGRPSTKSRITRLLLGWIGQNKSISSFFFRGGIWQQESDRSMNMGGV